MRFTVACSIYKSICVAFLIILTALPAKADRVDQLILDVGISGGRCNDSVKEWETWLNKTIPGSCALPIKKISVYPADSNLTKSKARLLEEIVRVNLTILTRYESAFGLCMASMSASAVHKDSEGSTYALAGYNILGWNTNRSNLMGGVERELVTYIKHTCDLAND